MFLQITLLDVNFRFFLQEGKDKQFLLAKLADVSGEGKKRAPAPQMRTVNENRNTIEVIIDDFFFFFFFFFCL